MSESTVRERIARALGAHQDDRGRDAPVFAGMVVHPRQAEAIADAILPLVEEAVAAEACEVSTTREVAEARVRELESRLRADVEMLKLYEDNGKAAALIARADAAEAKIARALEAARGHDSTCNESFALRGRLIHILTGGGGSHE